MILQDRKMQFTPFHARPTVICIKQSAAEALPAFTKIQPLPLIITDGNPVIR
jgi:hypothetical protein